jgi:AraC-like DNA-binding protein
VVERFAGPDARITNRERVAISNFVNAEWAHAVMPGDSVEDNAMLYLFPVDDGKYCLQLCYLSYADAPGLNATICSVQFLPEFFDQYSAEALTANLPFRFDRSTEQQFTVCTQTRTLLQQLEGATQLTTFIRSLQQGETAMHLLRRALEHITVPFTVCQVPACRFLAYESERDKIQDAVSLIQQNIDQPFTIKELARKVAMNECYLKKGFKTVTGKTIHEYQQELRIAKAKELLQQQGRSVTDVADMLGYSSISHFSTTFKRVTGMKPCELLA